MSCRRSAAALAAWIALTAVAPAGLGRAAEPVSVDDLDLLESPQGLRLTPDGRRAVYSRQWIDRQGQADRFALWVAERSDTGGAPQRRPLEAGEPDGRGPVVSPDGRWVAFVSTRARPQGWRPTPPVPPESDAAVDVWLVPAEGGAAVPLGGPEKPYGRVFHDGFFGRLAFAPDGKRLAFVADDGADPRTPEERAADAYLVRDDGGEGYTGYGPAQVWLADLDPEPGSKPGAPAARAVRRLTPGDTWYGDPQWSPDGRTLVVHANRTADRESARYSINKNYDLWAFDAATGAARQLTTGPGPEVSPRFAPDGKSLVCLSSPRKGTHMDVFNFAVVTLEPGGPSTRVVFDHHGPGADRPPHPAPMFPLPDDGWDGPGALIYNAPAGTETVTARIDLATGEGGRLAGASGGSGAGVGSASGRLRLRDELTPESNPALKGRARAEGKVVRWESDGRTVEGVLTLPPDPAAKPPFPLLVYPHGGPHSRTLGGFDFAAQVFAASGYAVFQPNYRGSGGYGQAFIDADRGDFGGGDVRDILAGADDLIRRGLADPARQFVYGSSYGGFLTCWLVGHSNRFRAAAAQNAVTDLDMMWGLSDIPSWTEWEFGGRPWEVAAATRAHSPLTFAPSVKTPTLVLHAREDRRCPIAMGLMFYKTLRASGVETAMVVYPGEPHNIKQPKHRADVLRRVLGWFQSHDRAVGPPGR